MNEIITAMDKEYIKGFSLLGGEPFEKENRMAVQYILKTNKGNIFRIKPYGVTVVLLLKSLSENVKIF